MSNKKPAGPCADNITIRALGPQDWKILRDMRLRAVKMHTNYFMGVPEEVAAKPPEFWQERLAKTDQCVFGLFDGENLIGITAIFPHPTDKSGLLGDLAYNFIEPDYRGRGLADLFYQVRIAWALENTNWTTITTGHRTGNEISRRVIERNGFTWTHQEHRTWPDGTEDACEEYALDLQPLREQS